MTWASPLYTVTLAKANGGITGIFAPDGTPLSYGTNRQCMWELATNTYSTGGCSNYPGGAGHTFDPSSGNLTLTWDPAGALPYAPTVRVVLAAPIPGQPFFDLGFTLVAPPAKTPPNAAGNGPYDSLQFPYNVVVETSNLSALYVPILPGVVLLPPFFC